MTIFMQVTGSIPIKKKMQKEMFALSLLKIVLTKHSKQFVDKKSLAQNGYLSANYLLTGHLKRLCCIIHYTLSQW